MYCPSATLILVGGRGTGKSTLAVIAAITLRRRFIDTISIIEAATGLPVQELVSRHSMTTLHMLEYALLETIISHYSSDCVVATSSQVFHEPLKTLLQNNKDKFPIVHISRSPAEIAGLFRSHPNKDSITHQAAHNMPKYHQCSSFEFTNLGTFYDYTSSDLNTGRDAGLSFGSPSRFDSLKQRTSQSLVCLEKNFLYFIRYIYGDFTRVNPLPSFMTSTPSLTGTSSLNSKIYGAFPRPWNCAEEKLSPYTNALFLPFYDLISANIDFDLHATGVDAVIIRVDLMASYAIRSGYDSFFYISTQVAFLRSLTTLPIIYDFDESFFKKSLSFRSPAYFGANFYTQIISLGIRLCVEYITIISGILSPSVLKNLIHSKNYSKIISTHTVSSWDLEAVNEIYESSVKEGFDIVQITSQASSLIANPKLQNVLNAFRSRNSVDFQENETRYSKTAKIPLIAYNKGYLGKWSQCLNKLLTPVDCEAFFSNPNSFYYDSNNLHNSKRFTLSSKPISLHKKSHMEDLWISSFKEKQLSDVLTLQDRNNAIYSLGLQPQLQFYHFGSNIDSCIAHDVNRAAFEAVYLPHQYTKVVLTKPSEIRSLLESPNFGGASISSPFNVTASQICDSLSPQSRVVGAVNSLRTLRDAFTLKPLLVSGENVSWMGIQSNVAKYISVHNNITSNTKALIIGAGDFSHAAVYAMVRLGVRHFYIWSKNRIHAELMINHFNLLFGDKRSPEQVDSSSHSHKNISIQTEELNHPNILSDLNGKSFTLNCEVSGLDNEANNKIFNNKSPRSSDYEQAKFNDQNDTHSLENFRKFSNDDLTMHKSSVSSSSGNTPKTKYPATRRSFSLDSILNSDDENDSNGLPISDNSKSNSLRESNEEFTLTTSTNKISQRQTEPRPIYQEGPLSNVDNRVLGGNEQVSSLPNTQFDQLGTPQKQSTSDSFPLISRKTWLTVLQGGLPKNKSVPTNKILNENNDNHHTEIDSVSPNSNVKSSFFSSGRKIAKNYGSLSFQQSAKDHQEIKFTILDDITKPWPIDSLQNNTNSGHHPQTQKMSVEPGNNTYPSILLQMTPETKLKLHPTFFAGSNYGICVECNYFPQSNTSFINQASAVRTYGWNSTEAISMSSNPSYTLESSNFSSEKIKNVSPLFSLSSLESENAPSSLRNSQTLKKDQSPNLQKAVSWNIVSGEEFLLEQISAHFEYLTEKKAPRCVIAEKTKQLLRDYKLGKIDKTFRESVETQRYLKGFEGEFKGKRKKRKHSNLS